MKSKINSIKLVLIWLLMILISVAGLSILFNTNKKNDNIVLAITSSDWYQDYPGANPPYGTCGENVDWQWEVVDGQGVLTIGGTGTTISNTDGWQGNTSLIHKVIIGDNITTIDVCPWTWATTEIKLSANLNNVNGFTFRSCEVLTTVKCSDNDPNGVITLPSGVTEIGDNFFLGCANITFVKLNNNITSIGDYAFSGCMNLTTIKCTDNDPDGVITLPSGITEITENLFGYGGYEFHNDKICEPCISIVSVRLNDNITKIGDFAFAGCQSLTTIKCADSDPNGVATLPEKLEYIGIGAFESGMSFGGCAIRAVNFSSNVIYIGYDCFADCANLCRVNGGLTNGLCIIPSSVEFIGGYAFFGCDLITDVVIEGDSTQLDDWGDLPFFINNDCYNEDDELYLCKSGNYHIYIPNEENFLKYQSDAQTHAEEDEYKSWAKYFGVEGMVINGMPKIDKDSVENNVINILIPSIIGATFVSLFLFFGTSFIKRKRK